MHQKGILVSTFILPDEQHFLASAEAGCNAVELHTGSYANAATDAQIKNTSTNCAMPAMRH